MTRKKLSLQSDHNMAIQRKAERKVELGKQMVEDEKRKSDAQELLSVLKRASVE